MLEHFQNYSLESLKKDIIAGVIVGIVAVPLGMAFAIASGVRPEYGIYSTVIAGLMVAIFGGSKFQIAGPTGAFIPIIFAIVTIYGYENLLIAGIMAGVFLTIMGLMRLGTLIKFIPRPVTIGFTSGIAVVIFSGQIANFLGLQDIARHEYFHQNMAEIISRISTYNIYSIIIAVIGLFILILSSRLKTKIPGSLIAIVVTTLISVYLFPGKVPTIGTVFGDIPQGLPSFSIPHIDFDKIIYLLRPALTIAFLGSVESLLSCVVADGMTNQRHNSNRELIGQGIANILTPLFGGIPATGAIARTATNIKSGAVSPLSAIFHSITVLGILLIFAPYASQIPLATMAPILMIVAWNMSSHKELVQIIKTTKSDASILMTTFILTVFVDLIIAVEIGLLLAVVLFIKRMTDVLKIEKVLPDLSNTNRKVTSDPVLHGNDCGQIDIFKVDGALFFGVAEFFEDYISSLIKTRPKVLILCFDKVMMLDATAENNMVHIVDKIIQHNATVIITEIQAQPLAVIKNSGLYEKIGAQNIFPSTGIAISKALTLIDPSKCVNCKQKAFTECEKLSCIQQQH